MISVLLSLNFPFVPFCYEIFWSSCLLSLSFYPSRKSCLLFGTAWRCSSLPARLLLLGVTASGQQEWAEVGAAEDRRRGGRQILVAIVHVALPLRELVEHGRVVAMECGQVHVGPSDGGQGQKEDVAVERVRSLHAVVL